ncbi:MAG: hypothetical protein JKY67_00140 [Pseudomonadales bacterium]|nr:hypothetical protein [Pseudomonadales bacterium]
MRQRILGRQGQAAVNKQLEDQRFLTGATVASAGQQARLNEAQSRLTESSLAADLGQSTRDARFEAGQAGVEEQNTRAQIALNQARADAENQPGNIAAQQNLLKAENDARIAQANAAGGEAGRAERRGAAGEEGQLDIDRAVEQRLLEEEGGLVAQKQQSTIAQQAEESGFPSTQEGVNEFIEFSDKPADSLASIRGKSVSSETEKTLDSTIDTINIGLRTIPKIKQAGYAKQILARIQENSGGEGFDISSPRFESTGLQLRAGSFIPDFFRVENAGDIPTEKELRSTIDPNTGRNYTAGRSGSAARERTRLENTQKVTRKYRLIIARLQKIANETPA